MASLASRRYFGASTTTTTTTSEILEWDPEDVLQLCNDSRCVGYAPSRGRKCLMPIRYENVMAVDSIVGEMAQQQPDAKALRPLLVRLARHGLCVRFHQYQVEDMVEKWSRRITAAYPSSREPYRDLLAQRDEEVATLLERLREMEQRYDLLEATTPPSASLSRVSTSNISSLHLSRTSTTASSTTFNTRAAPAVPAPRTIVPTSPRIPSLSSPIRQARRTIAPTSPVPRLASPFSPVQSSRQPTVSTPPIAPTNPATRSLSSIPPTRSEPQASTSTPRTIAPTSPISPTASSSPATTPISRCLRTHIRRLPYDDECPVCYEGDDLGDLDASEVVWCRSSCGRSVHKSCFEGWRAQCERTRRIVDCPVCRIKWEDDCDCLGCIIRHKEKRTVEGDCSICCQKMGCDDNDEDEEGELVWCKDGCGQSVHKDCFETWKNECESNERATTCVVCRAEWKDECGC